MNIIHNYQDNLYLFELEKRKVQKINLKHNSFSQLIILKNKMIEPNLIEQTKFIKYG